MHLHVQQQVSTLACLVTPSAQNETPRNPPAPELPRACWTPDAAPALVFLVTRRLEVRQAYWGSGAQVLVRLEAHLAFKERPILDQRGKDVLEHALLQPAAHIRVSDWRETSRERSLPARYEEWGQQQRPPSGSGALEAAEVQRRPAQGGTVSSSEQVCGRVVLQKPLQGAHLAVNSRHPPRRCRRMSHLMCFCFARRTCTQRGTMTCEVSALWKASCRRNSAHLAAKARMPLAWQRCATGHQPEASKVLSAIHRRALSYCVKCVRASAN